ARISDEGLAEAHSAGLKIGLEGDRPSHRCLRGWRWGGDGDRDHSLYDKDGLTIARIVLQDDGRYHLRTPTAPMPVLPPPPRAKDAPETFSEAFERYVAIELDGTSDDTIRDYRRKVKIFTDKVGDLPLAKITDHMAVDFLDGYLLTERKQTATTRNTYA